MSYPVKETPCTHCDHSQVCMYKEDFLSVIESVNKAQVPKLMPDGKYSYKTAIEYDFVSDIQVACKYHGYYR